MTNVIKHADAANVEVDLTINDGTGTLTVDDDGRGIPLLACLSGVANVCERAQLRGGTCTITPRIGGGSRIEWSVPALGDQETARETAA